MLCCGSRRTRTPTLSLIPTLNPTLTPNPNLNRHPHQVLLLDSQLSELRLLTVSRLQAR